MHKSHAPANKQFLIAAQKGHLQVIRDLLREYSIPKHTKIEAVKKAVARGHDQVFEFLYRKNPTFHNATTLAGSAAHGGHNRILHYLLKNANPCKETIMIYAARGKNFDVVHAMLKQGQTEATLRRRDKDNYQNYMDWRNKQIDKEFQENRAQISENNKTTKVILKRRSPKP